MLVPLTKDVLNKLFMIKGPSLGLGSAIKDEFLPSIS